MRATCVFVSNYLNHHQIPFCNAMYRLLKKQFLFIQTQAMEEERIRMGWNQNLDYPYLKKYYEQPEECREIIEQAKLVLFGGCEDERYIEKRLEQEKPVVRICERMYKTGQWKAVSPRGLRKKYHDHTRYRRKPVYLLCAGGYVASDYSLVRAYPGKMYRWGYFPEFVPAQIEELLAEKGYPARGQSAGEKLPYILWAARMIDWKHPELALLTARYLKEQGLAFRMDLIGGGELREQMEELRRKYGLEDCVGFLGFQTPQKVREVMKKADIFLFTSDRQEGWGAVANEAMNSGCALVADHMIGAVPYLVKHGENGLVYRTGRTEELFSEAERLVSDKALCRRLGRNAYETVAATWNAENAAAELLRLCLEKELLAKEDMESLPDADPAKATDGPCTPAPVIGERKMYRLVTGKG